MTAYTKYLPLIHQSGLFAGISMPETEHLLDCMNAEIRTYDKGETILRAGDIIHNIGMILDGTAIIEREDFWGNVSVMADLHPASTFAEAYASLSRIPVDVTVVATSRCTVIFMDITAISTQCNNACAFHGQMIRNLMRSIAEKNIQLNSKIDCISKKTIREKLMAYLSEESMKNHSASFDIPFNRQQLADYLFVDRSALSNEISKLAHEGILTSNRNHFEILKQYE